MIQHNECFNAPLEQHKVFSQAGWSRRQGYSFADTASIIGTFPGMLHDSLPRLGQRCCYLHSLLPICFPWDIQILWVYTLLNGLLRLTLWLPLRGLFGSYHFFSILNFYLRSSWAWPFHSMSAKGSSPPIFGYRERIGTISGLSVLHTRHTSR